MSANKRYTITIVEYTTEDKNCGREWEPGAGEKTTDNEKAFGYSPTIVKQVEVTREVYSQHVENLNVAEVIIAVNRMAVEDGKVVASSTIVSNDGKHGRQYEAE